MSDVHENLMHGASTNIPSTPRQLSPSSLNPIFTFNNDTIVKPHVRRQQNPKTAASKHTMVFCSSQILPYGDVNGMGTEHRDREGLDPEHLVDPLDDHNVSIVNAFEHAYTHPIVPMSGDDGNEMSDEEVSMVQESPLVMMADIHGQ